MTREKAIRILDPETTVEAIREKLVELLQDGDNPVWGWFLNNSTMIQLADYLISHGVTVQENVEISDELLKQLKNAPITICKEEPSIELVQEWISVDDRLPDIGIEVLVYSEDDGICVDYYGGDSFGYYDVTHWMPLPEPPKEDDNAKMQ